MPEAITLTHSIELDELRKENARLAGEKNQAKEETSRLRASLTEQNALTSKARAELRKAKDEIRNIKQTLAGLIIGE